MRKDIFAQARAELKDFKTSVLTPEVLEEKRPELKALIAQEYSTLMASPYVKQKIAKLIKDRVNQEVFDYFQSQVFRKHVRDIIDATCKGVPNV
jgi:hypothetical protein